MLGGCGAAAAACHLLGSDALRFFAPTLGTNPTPEQGKAPRPLISSMPSLWSRRASWRSRERRQMWRGARAGMGHDSAVVRILSLRRAAALHAQHSVQQTGGMACQQSAGSVVEGAGWERQIGRRRLARHPQPRSPSRPGNFGCGWWLPICPKSGGEAAKLARSVCAVRVALRKAPSLRYAEKTPAQTGRNTSSSAGGLIWPSLEVACSLRDARAPLSPRMQDLHPVRVSRARALPCPPPGSRERAIRTRGKPQRHEDRDLRDRRPTQTSRKLRSLRRRLLLRKAVSDGSGALGAVVYDYEAPLPVEIDKIGPDSPHSA